MTLTKLNAISPVDGRYRNKTETLQHYFSEFALIKYRVKIEIEYFILLSGFLPEHISIDASQLKSLRSIYQDFNESEAAKVKEIENTTNHDVKAVEYYIKNKFEESNLSSCKEWIHFGLTSQDINNTAVPLSLKDAWLNIIRPQYTGIIEKLTALATAWSDIPMLAKTHGQPASPTILGKEIYVFVERLQAQLSQLEQVPFSAKFGGATGNFNAHHVAFPEKDWVGFGNQFVNEVLGMKRSQYTTQIEHYDNLAAFFDGIRRLNTILLDLSKDMWAYISMNYFTQKIKEGEVGSSAMPHKVNPIDFENAEGNLGIANAILGHFSEKLPVSRLQRDLTDSTVLRNIGVPLAHVLISLQSLKKGLDKINLNKNAIDYDLNENWAVVAEAIQTILRTTDYPNPYEALKNLTRKSEKITRESIVEFINELNIDEMQKERLKSITPFNYTGSIKIPKN